MFIDTNASHDPSSFGGADAQASSSSNIVVPRSAMLVAVQMLLDSRAEGSADRIRILRTSPVEFAGAEAYQCTLGRSDRQLTLVVPVLHRFYKTSVLSILMAGAKAQCKLLPNGMPGAGLAEIERWGDSGNCEIRWSRSMVDEYLRQPRFASMDAEARRSTTQSYGIAPTLVLAGESQPLPPIAQCEKVWRALHGESVVVSSAELDMIEPVLCCGLRLVSAPNPHQVGLLDQYVLQLPSKQPR